MILAFTLSMPNSPSWNGQWSGAGRKYVITKSFRGKKEEEKAATLAYTGYYRYNFSDGWSAGVNVDKVDSRQAAELRKESDGFCGYEWMVRSICEHGEIRA